MKLEGVILLSIIFVLYAKTFPTLPNTFSLNLEWSMTPENRTFSYSENYDYENQRVKFIFYNETETTIEYFFLKTVSFLF
jgi:hypothetical protein